MKPDLRGSRWFRLSCCARQDVDRLKCEVGQILDFILWQFCNHWSQKRMAERNVAGPVSHHVEGELLQEFALRCGTCC